jgi:hypothetical protein
MFVAHSTIIAQPADRRNRTTALFAFSTQQQWALNPSALSVQRHQSILHMALVVPLLSASLARQTLNARDQTTLCKVCDARQDLLQGADAV